MRLRVYGLAIAALVAIFAASPSALIAQPPIRELPRASKEIEDPFSLVIAAREIHPGQLVVSDGVETQVSVVDFAKGTRTALGRKGSGPGEYSMPAALFRLGGDTLWVLDGVGAAARIVAFLPDLKAGTTFTMILFDQQDSSIMQGAMFSDTRGQLYSTSMKFRMGTTGPIIPDSMELVRFDPRSGRGTASSRVRLARVRTPSAGKQEIQNEGGHVKVKTPFPGLVAADAWTAFPDGRVALVRGGNYSVEFITSDGKKTAPALIAYEHYKVTDADKKAELDEVKRTVALQMQMVKKMLPPNVTLDIEITAPPDWPAEYPPLAVLTVLPGPNGDLWVKRSVPARIGTERWDVIDRSGKLVARWQLPKKVSIVALGQGAVYTVRTDEDDLRYVQRVQLPQ